MEPQLARIIVSRTTLFHNMVAIILLLHLLHLTYAHQSVSYPTAISHDVACRIGFRQNCPGPCPRNNLRKDMTPNNPSIITRRGGWVTLNTLKNNHHGGFSRWSIVHIRDMHNKQKHSQNAFLYTCSDLNKRKCDRRHYKRDCNYDLRGEHYRHFIQIPRNIVDGVYVLGWVWYGGGEKWGTFGDYYDCVYMKVQGGPIAYNHRPQFLPGKTATGGSGKCRATVNRIGICWKEPCPNGGRYTTLQKPFEFTNRLPPLIPRSRYYNPYRQKPRGPKSPFVMSITIRSADVPGKIYTTSKRTRFPYIYLTARMRSTVTAEVSGNVRFVTFYVNGKQGRTDNTRPYTIAGDWVEYRTKRVKYAPWKYDVFRKVITLSARATGWDGSEHWRTIELSTNW